MEKTCFKCSQTKPVSDFYRHAEMADGYLGKCKECAKQDAWERRRTNPYVQEYERKRAKRPERRKAMRQTTERWREKNPQAYKAHTALNNAVRDGKIKRGKCAVCGTKKWVHAHHYDYSKPLDVEWLCALHHHRGHALVRKITSQGD